MRYNKADSVRLCAELAFLIERENMNIGVILAAGTGSRVGAEVPKQFIKVNEKPILAYTLDVFQTNKNIDCIEIVCHRDWIEEVEEICRIYKIDKVKWICIGGDTFQRSVMNGVMNLKGKIQDEDIVVLSFGVSPMTPQGDIDDSIRVCIEHGNAIASKDIDLCTCIKDDELSTTQNIFRESLKGFANPWTFRFGELYEAYKLADDMKILDKIEPHTTSLYLALNKRLWFSPCTSVQDKITHKSDVEMFKAFLLLKKEKEKKDDYI